MVKYATALQLGTAESESILRRFTRGGQASHLLGARGARRSGAHEFWEPGAGPTCLHAVEATVERESVFEDFYRAERTTILRAVVYALEDADLGAEATDEAWARAYERWDDVSAMANPAGWVFRVAVNHAQPPPAAAAGAAQTAAARP